MSYSSFTNFELKEKFGVEQIYHKGLFTNVPSRPANDWLISLLAKTIDFALAQGLEKARSEYIIAPVFLALREQAENKISIFQAFVSM
jgi:hypothetical protein